MGERVCLRVGACLSGRGRVRVCMCVSACVLAKGLCECVRVFHPTTLHPDMGTLQLDGHTCTYTLAHTHTHTHTQTKMNRLAPQIAWRYIGTNLNNLPPLIMIDVEFKDFHVGERKQQNDHARPLKTCQELTKHRMVKSPLSTMRLSGHRSQARRARWILASYFQNTVEQGKRNQALEHVKTQEVQRLWRRL